MPVVSSSSQTDRLLATLKRYWGYESFRPLQQQAMESILSGRDTLVVLPTGGGKSLCYQVPALCSPGVGVIISPLISLMKDQVDAACTSGISAAFLNSTQSPQQQRRTLEALRRQKLQLLYVSPERVTKKDFLEVLKGTSVSLFAVDEAHCVSQWGHDFRPQYRELGILREQFPQVGLHAFTATATERVRQDIVEQLGLRTPSILVGSFDRPNLRFHVERKSDMQRQIERVLRRHQEESGIIYCITRKEVEQWTGTLRALGIRARPYHAGLDDQERLDNQEAFLNDRVDVIVATVAFGMGIDKSNVRFVIHAGMPQSLEHYQQESGRAGRDGLEAECHLFYGGDDLRKWQRIFRDLPAAVRNASLSSLRSIINFCEGSVCRHRALVRHFGQDLEQDCGTACDFCQDDRPPLANSLIIGQKILSSVYRQEQKFGAEYTALVLRGVHDKRILERQHQHLSTFGLLADQSKETILGWIGQLVQQGFLERDLETQTLRITLHGQSLLKGELSPRLLAPSTSREQSSRVADQEESDWAGVDRELFERLRQYRTATAAERRVPPYLIFGDATLRHLAREKPSGPETLLRIPGIGQKKLDDLGPGVLKLIRDYCQEQSLSMDQVSSGRPVSVSRERRSPSRSSLAAFPLFELGHSIDQVMTRLRSARSTVVDSLCDYLQVHNLADPSRWLPEDVVAQVETAIDEVGSFPLKPIFQHLNGKVSNDDIRIVCECRKNRETARDAAPQSRTITLSDSSTIPAASENAGRGTVEM